MGVGCRARAAGRGNRAGCLPALPGRLVEVSQHHTLLDNPGSLRRLERGSPNAHGVGLMAT